MHSGEVEADKALQFMVRILKMIGNSPVIRNSIIAILMVTGIALVRIDRLTESRHFPPLALRAPATSRTRELERLGAGSIVKQFKLFAIQLYND